MYWQELTSAVSSFPRVLVEQVGLAAPLSLAACTTTSGHWPCSKPARPGPRRREETSVDGNMDVLKRMYDRFNARDIDGVLAALADHVAWANGMDGGHVHGRKAVREYWTRQWAIVSPHVEPASFDKAADGSVVVKVQRPSATLKAGHCRIKRTGCRTRWSGTCSAFRTARSLASTSKTPHRCPSWHEPGVSATQA